MANIKREKFNLSFSSDLLRKLRQMAHERTMAGNTTGINVLVEDAVELWIQGIQDVPVSINGKPEDVLKLPNRAQSIPEEFQPWVSYLLHILTENNAFAAPSIKKNLEAFVRLTDLDGGAHGPPTGEPENDPWGGRPPGHLLQEASELRGDAARITKEHHRKRPGRRKDA